jgi:RNA polymerase sigma-70 factor (ECF subfamily)
MGTKQYEREMASSGAHAGVLYDQLALSTTREDLVEACQQGDEAAFRALYLAHRGEVHRIVFRLIGPSDELEDVVQEVFFQVHRSIGNFRGNAKFSTWLHRVAVNVALQHLRRRKAGVVSRLDDRVGERSDEAKCRTPQDCAETQDRLRAVYSILDEISPKKRAVLVMHDMQGMSAQQVAEIVGAPVFTVRTRLFYARREFYRKVAAHPAFAGDLSALGMSRK